jgi:AmmeMemoRadiSam system protein B
MPSIIPPLRPGLDVFPSSDPSRPGLLVRDPLRYTDAVVYVPPLLAAALGYFDGEHTDLEMQEHFTRATGRLVFSDDVQRFVGALREQGFLETGEFDRLRVEKHQAFREAAERPAVHAGAAYPADAEEVHSTFEGYFQGIGAPDGVPASVLGVAAPHVSPEGGRNCYAVTYRRLAACPALAERTFVVLGTSHYGAPEKFGLTRKPFVTPLGTLRVDTDLVDWLEQQGGEAVSSEDYCHAVEHSIEFQCVFLQHALGPELKILPILCGPFVESLRTGRAPETHEVLAHFFEALGNLAESHAGRLFWVLGIDLAHVGRRYGDAFTALANLGAMADVAQQDQRRLEAVCAGDPREFFELVRKNGDELKWCGYPPLYTFGAAVPRARGRLLHYEQWNIDPHSVVSFASLEFLLP